MGRHSSGPSDEDAVRDGRSRSGSLGPVTDPLLLDPVERSRSRAQTALRSGGAAARAPISTIALTPRGWIPVQNVDDGSEVDEVSPLSRPRSAPRGTRIPMEFDGAPEPFDEPEMTVAFTDEQRMLLLPQGWPDANIVEARSPAPSDPLPSETRTPTVPSANSMRTGEIEMAKKNRGDPARDTLGFWLVFGVSVLAVLTFVALLPF